MIHTVENFYNKVATDLDSTYYPEVKYYHDNKNTQKIHSNLELFNNGCLTYRQLIGRLAKSCEETTFKIHERVSKYIISFGSYEYKTKAS